MYWMSMFLCVSFAVLLLNELGFLDWVGRPIIVPLVKFAKWALRKLHRKKKNKNYNIKKDFHLDSGIDEERVDKELISFEDIDDEDPLIEEKRVDKLNAE